MLAIPLLALVFIVAGFFMRNIVIRIPVNIPLCARHQRRWTRFTPQRMFVFAFMIPYFLFLWPGVYEKTSSWQYSLSFILFLASYAALMFLATRPFPRFSIKKIDEEYVWIKGCGEAFLACLPEIARE